MKKLWLKKAILTLGLTLSFAAAASAQTTGDARCANSTAGNYWMAVTQNSGYCTSPPAQTSTNSACADKEPGQPWLQCVLQEHATEIAAAKSAPQQVAQTPADPQCANSTLGKFWVPTEYGGYCTNSQAEQSRQQKLQQQLRAQRTNWLDAACPNKEPEEAWRQCVMAAVSAKAEARENTSNEQVARQQQQAEYQRQLLQQQADYQRQLLQQQAQLARRQMALQYLMNRPMPSYTPVPPVYNPSVVVPFYNNLNNNNIHCTTQYVGGTAFTNCY